jgi:FkbM family methyltransferase
MSREFVYNRIKNLGFNPNVIVDCGACKGEWSGSIKSVFSNSFVLGIDANDWNENGCFPNTNDCAIEVLSNKDGEEIIFYKKVEGLCTGDSIFKEDTQHYMPHNTIEEKRITKTLESLCSEKNITKIDLLKIDTQGSEILIMQGLGDMLKEIEFIELECSLVEYNIGGCMVENIFEFLKNDFRLYEVIELHRHYGQDLIQVDLVFQNKKSKIQKVK